jgi:hypothetical protein
MVLGAWIARIRHARVAGHGATCIPAWTTACIAGCDATRITGCDATRIAASGVARVAFRAQRCIAHTRVSKLASFTPLRNVRLLAGICWLHVTAV